MGESNEGTEGASVAMCSSLLSCSPWFEILLKKNMCGVRVRRISRF